MNDETGFKLAVGLAFNMRLLKALEGLAEVGGIDVKQLGQFLDPRRFPQMNLAFQGYDFVEIDAAVDEAIASMLDLLTALQERSDLRPH